MCAPCKHKQAMAAKKAMQSSPAFQKSQGRTLENIDFLHLYYIGTENEIIPSIVPNVSYGTKAYGALMFVASIDYSEHPELWAENEPTYNVSSN